MKKQLCLIFFGLFFIIGYTQEGKKEYEDLYLYIEKGRFIGDVLGYRAYFSIKSYDKRFQSDIYHFKINSPTPDYHSLYSLSKPINIDSISYIKPEEYYINETNCDLHTELSLYKRIYIITDIPRSKMVDKKDKFKKHIIWYTSYVGTLKDLVYTNMSGKILLED